MGGRAIDETGCAAAEGNACRRQSIRRGAARRGRRSEVGFAADAAAPRTRSARFARGTRTVRESAAGAAVRPTRRRVVAEARAGRRSRHPDRSRTHGRHLLRQAARHRNGRQPAARLQHRCLRRDGDRPHRSRRVRSGAQAQSTRVLGGQGKRARSHTAVARGHEGGSHRLSRRRTEPHVRGQRRHATRPAAEAVRRDRHRQHVRRHPLRCGGDADRFARHAAVGVARVGRTRTLRTGARIGAGHRRARHFQSVGDHPLGRNDVPVHVRRHRGGRADRSRRTAGARARLAHAATSCRRTRQVCSASARKRWGKRFWMHLHRETDDAAGQRRGGWRDRRGRRGDDRDSGRAQLSGEGVAPARERALGRQGRSGSAVVPFG